MTRPLLCAIAIVAASLVMQLALPPHAGAQNPNNFRGWDSDDGRTKTTVKVKVETGPNGIDVQTSVRRAGPGQRDRDEPEPRQAPAQPAVPNVPRTEAPGAERPPEPSISSEADARVRLPPVPQPRTWTEGKTVHEEWPDGRHIVLVPVYAPVWTSEGLTRQQLRQYPNEGGYTAIVDGEIQGVVWRPLPPEPALAQQTVPPIPADVRPGGGGGLDPLSVALDIESHIPLPDIKLRMNPGLGLVALPGWFWVEGYDGAPFGESRTVVIPPANPLDPNDRGRSFTVEVRVWGNRYEWSFGDGKGLATRSLGKRYPEESDIQHTYQHSSLPFAGGFPVRLTVEFAAEFRVDGAGPFGLPPIQRTYEAAHRVQEIQPVLIAPLGTR